MPDGPDRIVRGRAGGQENVRNLLDREAGQCPSLTMLRFQAGISTTSSGTVPLGMHWQASRDSVVTPRAVSTMSSSSSVGSLQDSSPCCTMTWQVEQAQTP